MWRDEIVKRNKGKGVFRCPDKDSKPRLRRGLGGIPKGLASRFYQLASGHAMLAPLMTGLGGWSPICVGGVELEDKRGNIVSRNARHGRKRSRNSGKM